MNDTLHGIACVDCGKSAPPTETPYTLIGRRHAWRLTFAGDAQGKRVPEWRCEKCFERVKRAQREALSR